MQAKSIRKRKKSQPESPQLSMFGARAAINRIELAERTARIASVSTHPGAPALTIPARNSGQGEYVNHSGHLPAITRYSREATRSGALGGGETPGPLETSPATLWSHTAPEEALKWLRALGGDKGVEALTMAEAKREAMRWVGGVPTKSGFDRACRIGGCGKARIAYHTGSGEYSWAPLGCGDAACPSCQSRKAKRYAWALKRWADMRIECDGAQPWLRMVTFTQLRMPGESCADAYARLMESFKRMRQHRLFRKLCIGGVRTLECVYRKHGEKLANGHTVRGSGYHVHIHALVEMRHHDDAPEAQRKALVQEDLRAILDLWLRFCDTAAEAANVRGVLTDELDGSGQCASYVTKYVTKAFDLPPYMAREFFSTMVGRRWVEGWGEWRDWRAVLRPKEKTHKWVVTELDAGELFEAAKKRLMVRFKYRTTADGRVMSAAFGVHHGGLITPVSVPAHVIALQLALDARSMGERLSESAQRSATCTTPELAEDIRRWRKGKPLAHGPPISQGDGSGPRAHLEN